MPGSTERPLLPLHPGLTKENKAPQCLKVTFIYFLLEVFKNTNKYCLLSINWPIFYCRSTAEWLTKTSKGELILCLRKYTTAFRCT